MKLIEAALQLVTWSFINYIKNIASNFSNWNFFRNCLSHYIISGISEYLANLAVQIVDLALQHIHDNHTTRFDTEI